jgi:hypothetical protein
VVGSRSRRRGVSVTLLAASGMVLAGLLAAAMPAAAVTTTPFNTNLVRNPGAEIALSNPPWDTFPAGDFTRHKYGPAGFGFPPKSEGRRIGGGTYFFNGGNFDNTYGTCPDAKQDIKLKNIGGAIDNGHVKVQIRAFAATNGAAELTAHFDVTFFNSNHENDNFPVKFIQKHATSTNEVFKTLQGSKVLPKTTRFLQVHLYSTPNDGSFGCQSSWDNISVKLVHV